MRRHQQRRLEATRTPEPKVQAAEPDLGIEVTAENGRAHWQLQQLKVSLSRRLRELQKAPVIVQTAVDPDGTWFFLVRGSLPRFASWQGVPCRYVQAVREVGLPAHQR